MIRRAKPPAGVGKPPPALGFGHGSLPIPEGTFRQADLLAAKSPQFPPSEEGHIGLRIARPAGSSPALPAGPPGRPRRDRHSDITRYSATDSILPFLLRETDAAGVPRDRVTLLSPGGSTAP